MAERLIRNEQVTGSSPVIGSREDILIITKLNKRLASYIKTLPAKIDRRRVIENITLGEPNNPKFGDLSTNAALVLSKPLRKSPLDIAEDIKKEIEGWEETEKVNIAKPGFINFNLKDNFILSSLKEVIKDKEDYGKNNSGNSLSINLEYVSSNPTGSLHIGHGRWGVMGDVLANLYMANGYDVKREYYVNDYGTQVKKFVECVRCIYLKNFGKDVDYPEDGYPKKTVKKVTDKIFTDNGNAFLVSLDGNTDVNLAELEKASIDIMIEDIKNTLSQMGVEFDIWFRESALYQNDNCRRILDKLKKDGLIYKKNGAVWFKSKEYGDDKDRVIIRTDGLPTYFASDIMYIINKAERGFGTLAYILGADHHGYVKRLKATAKALNLNKISLVIIIGQLVRIVKGGKSLKMSRRKGKVYTLSDLIEEVGKDAVRYFFSVNSFDTPMDFDIDLAKQKSNQNPVYYVQYAHARIESIIKNIRENTDFDIDSFTLDNIDIDNLRFETETERNIAKLIIYFPDEIYDGCVNNSPYFINQHVYNLASEFHYFYNHYRVIDESGVNRGRLALILLVKRILLNSFKIIGISAPKKM